MLHLTQHAAGVLANQTSLAHVSQQQVQLHTEIIWGETNGSSHSSKPRLSFSSHFVCVLKGVWDTSSLKRFQIKHNTYFLLAFDIPLPPASSSSSTSWGRLFSFSIFLGGPPKKSPMPFCQVGVGRGHTGFPPVYLFFAASYNNYSSLSTWSVCVCVCVVKLGLTRCGGLAAGGSVGWTGTQRLPGGRSCNSCKWNAWNQLIMKDPVRNQ